MEKKFTDFVPLEEESTTLYLQGDIPCRRAGSGKSFVVGKTALPTFGYKVINSDMAFEKACSKTRMAMTSDNIFSTKGQSLRDRVPTSPNNASLIIFKVDLVWLLTELARTTKKLKRRKSN